MGQKVFDKGDGSMRERESRKSMEVYLYLRDYIDQNLFSDNDKLPSENLICRKFSVSRTTVRSAIATLVHEGLLYTQRGSGTYIKKETAFQKTDLPSDKPKKRVGVILQGQDEGANTSLLEGLHSVFDESNIQLSIYYTDNKFANENTCLQVVTNHNFSGFIVDGVKSTILNPNIEIYNKLYWRNIPIIFYNNFYHSLKFPKVMTDNHRSAHQLVSCLVEAGHQNIAAIFVCDNQQSLEKFQGYAQALQQHGISFKDDNIKWCISNEAHDPKYARNIAKFLKSVPKCTAIICGNYMILSIVEQVLAMNGKSIPEDYSVVCFDYSQPDYVEHGVTCSIHPGYEIGSQLGIQLQKMMIHKDFRSRNYSTTIPVDIHVGRSVARCM